MVDKQPYVEKLLYIRDTQLLSLCEMAKELGLRYITLRYILDPEKNDKIREATARKIEAFINKHSEMGVRWKLKIVLVTHHRCQMILDCCHKHFYWPKRNS